MKDARQSNAKYLGSLSAISDDSLFGIIRKVAEMKDEEMLTDFDIRTREAARRHVRMHEAEVKYFMGTETGIEDIENPPNDN